MEKNLETGVNKMQDSQSTFMRDLHDKSQNFFFVFLGLLVKFISASFFQLKGYLISGAQVLF